MAERRRGLGRGIGALIPTIESTDRPSDIFFSGDERTAPRNILDYQPPAPKAEVTSAAQAGSAERAGSTPPSPVESDSAANSPASAPADLRPIAGLYATELPVQQIAPNSRQPRAVFDEEELEELAASIREVGLLQPVVVRPSTNGSGKAWELVMGERRLRAVILAGLERIPAIVRETDDTVMLRDALLENLHRAQLNPLEEASAYRQLLEDFACTHDELATRIARSRPQISNTIRLLKLPPLVQRRVAAGVLSAGHARALLGLTDGGAMERLAQRIVAEGLSVRATEEIIAMGDDPERPEMRRRPRVSADQPQLDDLALRLADRLDTRVKVVMGARRGRITVDFASLDDLDRILGVFAPGEAAR
ncbi:MAG: ParB/RepB/Spo0J family partition protein [Actinomycetota bacterium]